MRIFKYKNKLVEELGNIKNGEVIIFEYLKEEDKHTCPHCTKPINVEMTIVKDCLLYKESCESVDTISRQESENPAD